jgi:DnaJ-class molecular chaperone
MAEDYYKILEIPRTATPEQVQKAYRKLARKYHPDMNPDDRAAKEKFQKVQQAYDVLNDAQKRQMYDQFGSDFESMGGAGPGGGWRAAQGGGGFQDVDFSQLFGQAGGGGGFEDIFRQFAGGGRGRRRQTASRPGADVKHDLHIPFNTSITGGEAQLSMRRHTGKLENISVKIPAGIEDGKKIRLRGQGEPSPTGGRSGDLLIIVHVAKHPYYTRRGNDLEVSVPITLAEAALGAKIDVPTPKGEITLTIPPGTSSGKRLRLKGMGVPTSSGGHGDLYAEMQVVLPENWSDQDRAAIRELDDRHPLQPRANLRW